MKSHFLIDVLAWAEKRPQGFSYSEMLSSRKFKDWERDIVDRYLHNAAHNYQYKDSPQFAHMQETIFYQISKAVTTNHTDANVRYVLSSDALFKHIDHEELKLARENAREARSSAQKSIKIAMWALIASIVIPFIITIFVTQDVKIDPKQFQTLLNLVP